MKQVSGGTMTENSTLLNELTNIEELEDKTAPGALWDVVD
jgi:hypothetical protein